MAEEDAAGTDAAGRRRRAWIGRTVRIGGLVVAMLLAVGGSWIYVTSERLADRVQRYPNVFSSLDDRLRPATTGATTFLLLGSDSLSADPTTGTEATASDTEAGGQRSDVIMVARLGPSEHTATIVSLPRDSWVDLPGHGTHKINAAYSLGGPALLVRTVENLTGTRVDHFAVIDFAGFKSLTDAVGGIDVMVTAPTRLDDVTFHAGVNHLDGAQALAYVRQRKGLPGGDLDRVRRHQSALRALLGKAFTEGLLTDPLRGLEFLDALTRWVSVDDTLTNNDLRSLAWRLRDLNAHDITFLTAPVAGLGREGAQSVVHLDAAQGAQLWQAVRTGDLGSYLRKYPADALGDASP